MRRQCESPAFNRLLVYRTPKPVDEANVRLCNLIDEIYTKLPYCVSRRTKKELLERAGISINRMYIQRLMRLIGLEIIYQKPNLSRRNQEQKVYQYLLRNVEITRPNHVWSTDITFILTKAGFVYLMVVLDWFSRKVLSWRVSNTLDHSFCVEALEEALKKNGTPDIFDMDQGCQFMSEAFTSVLLTHNILTSMNGERRALDNVFVECLWRSVEYDEVYLQGYETMKEAKAGLAEYFRFLNTERFHQGPDERTPDDVYFNRSAQKERQRAHLRASFGRMDDLYFKLESSLKTTYYKGSGSDRTTPCMGTKNAGFPTGVFSIMHSHCKLDYVSGETSGGPDAAHSLGSRQRAGKRFRVQMQNNLY